MTLPTALLEPTVRRALAEDLGTAGDLTTNAIVPADHRSGFDVVARQPGVISGIDAATLAWRLLDSEVQVDVRLGEGASVTPGDVVATVFGPTRALLSGERVALNLLCHLSGVASATAGLVAAVAHTRARITCTRKTTVGLRALEKAAVRAGGGVNHRFGLHDAVLIKDNHIAIAGSLPEAIRRARSGVGHLVAIEFEVDTLEQLAEVLADTPTLAPLRWQARAFAAQADCEGGRRADGYRQLRDLQSELGLARAEGGRLSRQVADLAAACRRNRL